MKQYYSIDRFEEGLALCEGEDGKIVKLSRESLPPEAAEGDLLFQSPEQTWQVDREATLKRQEALRLKRERLLKK